MCLLSFMTDSIISCLVFNVPSQIVSCSVRQVTCLFSKRMPGGLPFQQVNELLSHVYHVVCKSGDLPLQQENDRMALCIRVSGDLPFHLVNNDWRLISLVS